MTISPGDTYDGIDVINTPPHTTTVTVLGGTTTSLRVLDSAVANIYGGTILSLGAKNQGTLNVFGLDSSLAIGVQDSARINLYGDAHQSVYAIQGSNVSMYPGSAVGSLEIQGEATGTIYGGTVNNVLGVQGLGNLRLYKVEVSNYLIAGDSSTVEIYGSDFTYDPTGGQRGVGLIQGFWLDGTPLSISLSRGPDGTTDTHSHIAFLPEPSTLVLLALGSLLAMRRGNQV